jgi:eukaryotic-like serine/threonine-protein kinase
MAGDPISKLAAILDRYHLLEPAQLAEVTGPLARSFPNLKGLAGELIRRGWLTPLQVNQIFQGRARDLLLESYVLLERLGEGGMGQVFKARNWKLNRLVALKIIRKERLNNLEIVRRFEREVRVSAQLNHPNVVHAYDCGERGNRHFYVMEYVDGINLAQLVRRDGPLSVDLACECIRQAALGLQHAFERGLVHRDIKPHNLLLTKSSGGQNIIKILDMGLARLELGDEYGTMTQEGAVLGTLDYIAPEQARNAHLADTRADLYSLGCTLHFLLTGQPPFAGGTPTEKLLKHQFQPPPSIQKLRPEVPASLAEVLTRLLAKQPEQRYQTPAETAAALASLLSKAAVPAAQKVEWVNGGGPPAGRGEPLEEAHPTTAVPADGEATAAGPSETPSRRDEQPLLAAAPGKAPADIRGRWSSIAGAPSGDTNSPLRRRRRDADQRERLILWSVIAGLTLLALILWLWILL